MYKVLPIHQHLMEKDNGTFIVSAVVNDKEFKYSNTDVENINNTVGTFVNNTHTRTTLPKDLVEMIIKETSLSINRDSYPIH